MDVLVRSEHWSTCERGGITHAKRAGVSAMPVLALSLLLFVATQIYSIAQEVSQRATASRTEPDLSNVAPQLSTLPLSKRGAFLVRLAERSLSRDEIQKSALNFSTLSPEDRQSKEMADYLVTVFEVAQKRDLLDASLTRQLGRLFAGDSFDPSGNGFGKISRSEFEKCLSQASPQQKKDLEAGIRDCLDEQIEKSPSCTPQESVQKLVRAMAIWDDEDYADSADCFFGCEYDSSWNLAVKHLGVLFLLKAREVSPEANTLSNRMVGYWLKKLADGQPLNAIKPGNLSPEDKSYLHKTLVEIGQPEILEKLAERAQLPENRHKGPVINSPSIIYAHQFRNLILKEIQRGFSLDESQLKLVAAELAKNESELTDMLTPFLAEEGTTDGLSGYNTYAVATTVLTSRNPGPAFQAMLAISDQEFAPYYVDSQVMASPRAGAGRTVPFRLVEVAHGSQSAGIEIVRRKLAKAAVNYMEYLPDLMYHARGRFWHRGDDRLAPYFFHPTVPYEAAALRMLSHDPGFSETERAQFRTLKDRLRRALIASQKPDGTFMLPDTVGDPTMKPEENGGYYSSAAWVNPLAGLALLCLIDDARELHTQYGILNPESFERR